MMYLWSLRWLIWIFLYEQVHYQCKAATWPLLNTSTIQLLGLFPDKPDAPESETTTFSVQSRAMFTAAVVLSQQFNITINGQLIGGQAAQTGGTELGAISSACRAISLANIIGIVGPFFSRETPVIADLAKSIGISTISYAATEPALSNKQIYPAFYRTIPSDSSIALALVKLFIQYNWTTCNLIFQNDDFGISGADAISQAFHSNNLTVTQTILFDLSTNSFRYSLKNTLSSSSSRIVIVWADVIYTPTIVQSGLDNDVIGPQFLWILSSTVSLSAFNPSYYSKLIGLMTIEATVGNKIGVSINTTLLNAAYALWLQYEPETFPNSTQVNNFALFAFDATWSLILSLQKLCSSSANTSSSCLSFTNSTFCFDHRFLNADPFLNIISMTNFLGVSGPVQFSNSTTDRINGIYYIIQNVQTSGNNITYVSVLQWTGGSSTRRSVAGSNVIMWPGSSLKPPSDLPSVKGVTLRIAIVGPPPFTMKTNIIDAYGNTTTKLTGYVPKLLDLLQAKMEFIPQITVLSGFDSYDLYVKAVADNVYDMLIGDVTITAERRMIVDFSTSIFDNSLRIIIREGTAVSYELFSFMKPFSTGLWLVILATVLLSALLVCLLERRQNEALKEKSFISAITMSVWFSYATLIGYGADFQARTAAGRLLTVGLYLLCMILVATYTANLASDLTVAKSQNIITGLDDIKNGKIAYSRIGIIVGSSIEDYYLREISGRSRNFYRLSSNDDMYNCLLNNTIDASMMDTGTLEYAVHSTYCNLTLVGADFDASAYGIAIRKDWLYTQTLDVHILSLRESGALDDLRKDLFDTQTCSDSSPDTDSATPLEALGGLFLTFAIVVVLSLLLFAWLKRRIIMDYFYKIRQRKNSLTKTNSTDKNVSAKNANESSMHHLDLDLNSIPTMRL